MDTNAYLAKSFEGFSPENFRMLLESLKSPMFWAVVGVGAVIVTLVVISGLSNPPSRRDSIR